MDLKKEVFSTGTIAKALSVSPRVVNQWCDAGKLKSYKLPTGSKHEHRRVTRSALLKFCSEHGIPIEELCAQG